MRFTRVNILGARTIRWYSQSIAEKSVSKSVFISKSKDIYTNLALEDWHYRNTDLTNHHILMLWQNEPCVVIGRHQNPWLEANVSELPIITSKGVNLARRDSGGGTVFHDLGNLNLTFFTPRERYNRRHNLEVITKAVFWEFGIQVDISSREDLTLDGKKISGTAAKLGRPNAYHHCTILVNADKTILSRALRKPNVDIKTNATKSIRSEIINLCDKDPNISIDRLINAIGLEYLRTPVVILDGSLEVTSEQKEFKFVDPLDVLFPGIDDIRQRYSSWDWCYGKTPKFTISKSFTVPNDLANRIRTGDVKVVLVIENGRVKDVSVFFHSDHEQKINSVCGLQGKTFSVETLAAIEHLLSNSIDDMDKFVTECLKQVVASI